MTLVLNCWQTSPVIGSRPPVQSCPEFLMCGCNVSGHNRTRTYQYIRCRVEVENYTSTGFKVSPYARRSGDPSQYMTNDQTSSPVATVRYCLPSSMKVCGALLA